jgi:hypothetical protein
MIGPEAECGLRDETAPTVRDHIVGGHAAEQTWKMHTERRGSASGDAGKPGGVEQSGLSANVGP